MKLIINEYELTGFVDGTMKSPPQFLSDREGKLVRDPDHSFSTTGQVACIVASFHDQQPSLDLFHWCKDIT